MKNVQKKTKILCILEGFNLSLQREGNILYEANLPVIRSLFHKYSWITLNRDVSVVGQKKNITHNTQLRRLNTNELHQITQPSKLTFDFSIESKVQNYDPKVFLTNAFDSGKNNSVHLVGLFSTGIIHSDLRHWACAIESAGKAGAERIIMHIISDGRDCEPQSLVGTWDLFVQKYGDTINPYAHKIFLGSLIDRFYVMDCDQNWERIGLGLMSMLGFKRVDIHDIGGNALVADFIKHKYNADIDAYREQIVGEVEKNNTLSDRFGTQNQHYTGTLDIFFDSQDREAKISGSTNVTLDIKTSLEVAIKSSQTISSFDEGILATDFYYFEASYGVKSHQLPPNGITKNDVVWAINFGTDGMRQFMEMMVDCNDSLNLGLVILGINDYGIGKQITRVWGTGESIESRGYYPIFSHKLDEDSPIEAVSKPALSQHYITQTDQYNQVTNTQDITDVIIKSLQSDLDFVVCQEDDKPELIKYVKEYWRAVEETWNGGLSVSEEDFDTTLKYIYDTGLEESIKKGYVFFITINGHKAGLIQIDIDTDRSQLFIFDLYIFPHYQNRGYGQQVCDYFKWFARDKNCDTIGLWVDKANSKAIAFYKRQGFCYREDTTFDWHNKKSKRVHTSKAEYWQCQLSSDPIHPIKHFDTIIVNYAHFCFASRTRDFEALANALESVDQQLARLTAAADDGQCNIVITSDDTGFGRGTVTTIGSCGEMSSNNNDNIAPCIFVSNSDPLILPQRLLNSITHSSYAKQTDSIALEQVFSRNNRIDLSGTSSWFGPGQIPQATLPLWYARLFLSFI